LFLQDTTTLENYRLFSNTQSWAMVTSMAKMWLCAHRAHESCTNETRGLHQLHWQVWNMQTFHHYSSSISVKH